MSSFTALMALSASKTQEQNNQVERAKEERRKKELLLQKQQAERDAKEREMEKRLRIKHFEDEKREEERRKRRAEAEKAREAAMQRKKDEQRDVLLYGPKKAASSRTSSSQASNGGSKERRKGPDVNDDDSPSGPVLTREELRERRQQAEMRRLYSSTRRSTTVHSYSKAGRRLPGGAVDITTTPQNPDTLSGKGVRDRIAAMPNTLTKLNTVKRDTRTIDEIRTDLQKKKEGKVLDGDEAKSFDDWFSTKKKEPIKKPHTSSSVGSDSNSQSSNAPTPSNSSSSVKKSAAAPSAVARIPKISTAKSSLSKPSSQPNSKLANGSRAGSLDKYPSGKGAYTQSTKGPKPYPADRERDRNSSKPIVTSASMKKRPRSESRSESPPSKRRAQPGDDEDLPNDISSTIWSLFGRKRDSYIGMDVFSDDEDMEADADALEREEMRSARIAKKEDMEAFEEERRHEEEKRRRKKEKERSSRY